MDFSNFHLCFCLKSPRLNYSLEQCLVDFAFRAILCSNFSNENIGKPNLKLQVHLQKRNTNQKVWDNHSKMLDVVLVPADHLFLRH